MHFQGRQMSSSATLRNQQSIISKTMSISLKLLLSGSLSILPLFCQGLISKASAAGTTYFYVATDGSDTAPGTSAQPFKTIQKAATAVRSINKNMTGDIAVILKGGTYQLNQPLTLSPEDSGTNGYNIIYKADSGAQVTLSGGRRLGRWSLFDGSKNIHRVWFGKTTYPREFYNGELRATRARSLDDPTGFTKTETGYTTTDLNLQNWKNISDVEIVSTNFWKSYRCGVSSIIGGNITMDQPCFKNSLHAVEKRPILNPSWIENAYELLDTEGEWYYNKSDGYIYYKPHPYENLSKAEAVAPILDKLVVGSGTPNNPVHNIVFQDLSIKHGTWYNPNTAEGYSSIQTGMYWGGDSANKAKPFGLYKSSGNISFNYAQNIVFKHNIFSHLSSAAIDFDKGSKHNTIENNRFDNIAGSAIQLGDTNWYKGIESTPRGPHTVSDNLIVDNYITKTGQEYHDTAAIFIGYTDHTQVVHNEITDIPYSGIAMGWFWNGATSANSNTIQNNTIHNFDNVLTDGGGIYTLGQQPNSIIDGNYIYDQYNAWGPGGGLYPDLFASGFTISNNVVISNEHRWLWYNTIYGNTVKNNFFTKAVLPINQDGAATFTKHEAIDSGTLIMQDNMVVSPQTLPTQAQDIINTAGIRLTAQQDIKQNSLPILPNLALNKSAIASSSFNSHYLPSTANDGVIDNSLYGGWSASGSWWRTGAAALSGDTSPWWQVDLGAMKKLNTIELTTQHVWDNPDTRKNFEIRVSNDPTFASYQVVYAQGITPLRFDTILKVDITDSNPYRYVRVAKTKNEYFSIGELKVF
jgi:Right handed beta helix region/F5/8 type C domain